MPNSNIAGRVRRGQIITTYGPGAIINLRSPSGAPISAVTGGLESWDKSAKPPGLRNRQRCFLSRLERKLQVNGFRLPPVDISDFRYIDQSDVNTVALVAKRFPHWLTCPKCTSLKPARGWARSNNRPDPARWCGACSTAEEKVYAVPVRFILTCSNGHLQEFPWSWWLRKNGKKPPNQTSNKITTHDGEEVQCSHENLYFRQGGSLSLSSLAIYCKDCGSWAGMGGIFHQDAFKGFTCSGLRPWLIDSNPQACDQTPRAVQRNSSSLYLAKFESALDIPPWTHTLQNLLGDWWPRLYKVDDRDTRLHKIEAVLDDINEDCGTTFSVESLNDEIEKQKKLDNDSDIDLRVDEYWQFTHASGSEDHAEFQVRPQQVSGSLSEIIDSVISVERLREVRALCGFSRLLDTNPVSELSSSKLNWLPATEVRGEGIFINFCKKYLATWASHEELPNRIQPIIEAYQDHANQRGIEENKKIKVSAEFLLLHTISHLLIRQISYECGYSAASLSERLYAHEGMSGILIYTSTSDSEGTLGGLSRLSSPYRFEEVFVKAIESAGWCSSDPLCIEGVTSHSETLNLSACHACLLLPETSCEHMNYFLDRALVAGLDESSLPPFWKLK